MLDTENILQTIAQANRELVASRKESLPLPELAARAREKAQSREGAACGTEGKFPFEKALRQPGMSFICECKKASPSKGVIAMRYDPVEIALQYEEAGAAAISCLTEPQWFHGSLQHLSDVATAVSIPVLRKDFIIDEYQIYEACDAGAAAVLLICGILSDMQLSEYVGLSHELGMSALVEAYEPQEVPRAMNAGARVIGVNNRDLRTFEVDFGRSIDLRPIVGSDRVFVSESGVRTRDDVVRLECAGVDAVLIGETLMRERNKQPMLDGLRGTKR